MSGRTLFESVEVGDALQPAIRVPTREQLIRYAGAANDFSPIHFDDDNARGRGFSGVIVHGLLKAAFLGELLETWSAPGGWVQKIATQYRGVDLPGEPLICSAVVSGKTPADDRGLVDFELRVENARGETTTYGTATVVLALEPGAAEES
jgi:acyl dehydratase